MPTEAASAAAIATKSDEKTRAASVSRIAGAAFVAARCAPLPHDCLVPGVEGRWGGSRDERCRPDAAAVAAAKAAAAALAVSFAPRRRPPRSHARRSPFPWRPCRCSDARAAATESGGPARKGRLYGGEWRPDAAAAAAAAASAAATGNGRRDGKLREDVRHLIPTRRGCRVWQPCWWSGALSAGTGSGGQARQSRQPRSCRSSGVQAATTGRGSQTRQQRQPRRKVTGMCWPLPSATPRQPRSWRPGPFHCALAAAMGRGTVATRQQPMLVSGKVAYSAAACLSTHHCCCPSVLSHPSPLPAPHCHHQEPPI